MPREIENTTEFREELVEILRSLGVSPLEVLEDLECGTAELWCTVLDRVALNLDLEARLGVEEALGSLSIEFEQGPSI